MRRHGPAVLGAARPEGHRRRLPTVVGVVGTCTFVLLAALCWWLADQNDQRLLQRQVDQASAALVLSIEQIQAPLGGAARAARANDGDPEMFAAMVEPLIDETAVVYTGAVLFELGSTDPLTETGAPLTLLADEPGVEAMLRSVRTQPFVVVDLLDPWRTIGFAVVDDPESPRFVVYTERVLGDDPTVRRRFDTPFAELDYAMYLGTDEVMPALLGASVRDLPLTGRRATAVVPYGDQEILLVGGAAGPLSGALMTNLWWIVGLSGLLGTALAVGLLRRLDASRREALALATQTALKHEEQRDIAETLQLSLLPRQLATPPGTEVASRYWPAGTAALIGGDFYDMFPIDSSRWGIVIGDVCGKGIEAAALTGLARHTIRTAARSGQSPSEVLRSVHLAMSDHRPTTFCTACFITFVDTTGAADTADGDGRDAEGVDGTAAHDRRNIVGQLVVALGGHPEPLLGRGDDVVPIGQRGGILGMVEPSITDVVMDVEANDTLVLYTDGLTDAPRGEAVPVEEIADVIRSHRRTGDVDLLADTIRKLKRSRRPSGSSDDTAVLVIRFGAGRAPGTELPSMELAGMELAGVEVPATKASTQDASPAASADAVPA